MCATVARVHTLHITHKHQASFPVCSSLFVFPPCSDPPHDRSHDHCTSHNLATTLRHGAPALLNATSGICPCAKVPTETHD